jgi:serine/threonine-protein kinase
MATVHHGLFRGESGFARTVAIKRLHPHFAKDREFSEVLRDEARVTARIRHPHVVSTLDVAVVDDEFLLVMDYVHGESLSRLLHAARTQEGSVPRDILSAIFCGALHGLHAAHEATDEAGVPLRIVHRDASPQNIMIGADGVARVLDFGIAKAVGRSQTTRNGELKGKLAYMAPEQLTNLPVDRRTDVYAIGVVLWEALTMQRLFPGDSEGFIVARIMEHRIDKPSLVTTSVTPELDAVVMKALAKSPDERFPSARDMALALEAAVPVASTTKVAAWVEELAGDSLARRARLLAGAEGPATELLAAGDIPSATGVSLASGKSRPDVAVDGTGRPTGGKRPWLGYAAVLLAGAGITLVATRGVQPRLAAAEAPVSPPAESAKPSPPPSGEPAASPKEKESASTETSTAPPSATVPPKRPRPSPRPTSPAHAAAATTGSGTSGKPREHCEWHTDENGISVPSNCH